MNDPDLFDDCAACGQPEFACACRKCVECGFKLDATEYDVGMCHDCYEGERS